MSSEWKNASIPAEKRIEMLRSGNKEVFDEEVERTKTVVKARQELGLDTKAQEDWLDTVAYNYNLYNAERMGISPDRVSKTGYASLYLGTGSGGSGGTSSKSTSKKTTSGRKYAPVSEATGRLERARTLAMAEIGKKYAAKKAQVEKEFYENNPRIREYILNKGGHDDGGSMAKANAAFMQELEAVLADVDAEMASEMEKSAKKYASFIEQIYSFREGGASREGLNQAANVYIKKAAREDGYDFWEAVSGKKSNDSKASTPTNYEITVPPIDFSAVTGKESSDDVTDEVLPPVTDGDEGDKGDSSGTQDEMLSEDESDKKLVQTFTPADFGIFKKITDNIPEITESVSDGDVEKALSIIMKHAKVDRKKAAQALKLITLSLSL